MHYLLGTHIRNRYMDEKQFLNQKYSPEDIYVQTTDRQRTILSATSQLDGLYERETDYPTPDSLF